MTEENKKQRASFFNLHLTSNISISLVLFMIGLITWLLFIATDFAHRSQQNIPVAVQLDDSISSGDRARLEKYLRSAHFAQNVIYISKDSALTDLTQTLGDDPTRLLGFNPVNASYEIYLTQPYANVDSIRHAVIPKLQGFSGVVDITYEQDVVELLDKNLNRLLLLISAIAIVLLFISVVLINNTIRLSIYSKRFIINTMKLVGARNSFIRAPFVRRSMVNALIGAIIGMALLAGAIYMTQIQINGYTNLAELYNPKITVPVALIMVAVSVLINYLSTVSAVNRYLKMSTNKLYFV